MPPFRAVLRSPELQAGLVVAAATILIVWLAAVTGIDRALLMRLAWPQKHPRSDLLLLLRVWGSLWSWLLIAGATAALGWRREAGTRRRMLAMATALLVSPAIAGMAAELLKLLLRRERPSELEAYVFRSWLERPWSTSGLGLPSSHASVAFGGSLAIALIYPELRWPALLLALGCGYTRIASGAHYPSDVLAAAVVGAVAALLVHSRLRRWIGGHGAACPKP